ncbi:MAG: peptidoglycan DD-metalloendopeptidase family protein, partial [Alistipes sp.]|nr:peptidoglycan DD-metalloendopeptidase family protein [Alistipes sp.]
MAWIAVAVVYYVIISFVSDTPIEHALRHATDKLEREYEILSERYDSLSMILDNIADRDRNVFRKLFESNPYDLNADYQRRRLALHERLLGTDNRELMTELSTMVSKCENRLGALTRAHDDLEYAISNLGEACDYIPSIQPVNNSQLTLLAAGKKQLIDPFHRTMREHHGVDYLIAEGTAVFATADGVVESLSEKNSTHGKAVTVNHGNGYKTSYSHLLDIRVQKGQHVKRGDIIALSGTTCLSLAPHLHYEVIFNDTRVDPVHYF